MVGTDILTNQLQTGKAEMPSIVAAVEDSGAVEVTLLLMPQGVQEDDKNPMEIQDDNCHDSACNEAKFHQGTQTELKTLFTTTSVVLVRVPVKAKNGDTNRA